MSFEIKSDCPPVERIIWDLVAKDCGDFIGVNELSFADLCCIKSAAEFQMAQIFKNSTEEQQELFDGTNNALNALSMKG
mgnify:CR=1 FL=1